MENDQCHKNSMVRGSKKSQLVFDIEDRKKYLSSFQSSAKKKKEKKRLAEKILKLKKEPKEKSQKQIQLEAIVNDMKTEETEGIESIIVELENTGVPELK